MRTLLALSALSALALAGCATDANTQYAKADCKLAPVTTMGVAGGKTRPATSLEQRDAEMSLATSQYRRQQLYRYGQFNNNVEDAMYDCDRK